jgi:hypothetical protein
MKKKVGGKLLTLTDADITSQRSVSRRSLLGILGFGLGTAAVAGRPGRVMAQQRPGCTDNDRGPNEDPPNNGRRCRAPGGSASGCTDNDRGPQEDPPGSGRWCWI